MDPVFNEEREWRKAHNDYAQTFAELGMVGLFFLGWLLFASIKTSIALLDGETKGELRYLLMGVIVALGGLSITAFFSFPFQLATPTFVFALYLGVLGGCSSQPIQPEKPCWARQDVYHPSLPGLSASVLPVSSYSSWYCSPFNTID